MKKIEPKSITLSQLAKYRSQVGLTQKQVADGMNVSLPVVQYIEEGDFEKIGAAPFIRGHVINYCKYLKLDATEVLSQISGSLLSHKNVQRPEAFLPASVSKVRLRTNHYGRYALGTTMLAVLTVSAYFVWDKWGLMSGANPPLQLLESDKETVTYSSILPPVQEMGSISGAAAEDDRNQSLNTEVDADEEGTAIDENQAGEMLTDGLSTEGSINDEPEVHSGVELDSSNEAELTEPAFVIEFDLQQEAWVSIKTDAGDKVVHDLIGPGIRRYESNQPMSLRIGNADNLKLTINGEAVDVVRFSDKNLAKFSWPLDS